MFARERGIAVYDIDSGIGTHVAIDEGLVMPGDTLVSTDSHANILGAIGAFGQGMGDQDIAAAWAYGAVWFEVPRSMKVSLAGILPSGVSAKDIVLCLLRRFGASGLLGYAAEIRGRTADVLGLSARITVSSMATEMGGIILLFPPNQDVLDHFHRLGKEFRPLFADRDADYERDEEVDLSALEPLVSRPGHPEDVVPVSQVEGTKIDSAFIGSCTNGRLEDLKAAAEVLEGRRVAPGVVLKIVPATRLVWRPAPWSAIRDARAVPRARSGRTGRARSR